MAYNYDNTAWFYDRLSRLVYGKTLILSQVYLLQYIPAGATILIAGGGTGWILEEITKIHASGLKITYAEISARMMRLSRKRNTGQNKVTFIHEAIENIKEIGNYDVVVTCFLFDNFSDIVFKNVFGHIHQQLKPQGIWLYADFQLTGRWWQGMLLKSMLLLFRLLCRIEANKLPDVKKEFKITGYQLTSAKTFFGEFILSEIYKKPKN